MRKPKIIFAAKGGCDITKPGPARPRAGSALLRRTLIRLTACLLLMGGWPAGAAALSGPAVLDAMLKQMGSAKTVMVRQRVESVAPAPAAAPGSASPWSATPQAVAPSALLGLEAQDSGSDTWERERAPAVEPAATLPPLLSEELIYQLPGGFRAEIRSETIQRIYLEVDGEALLLIDGRRVPAGESWFERFKDLLLFNRRLSLHRHLVREGVDLAVASLGLWQARPVFVLGARFPDAAPAQIWVDKESLLPLRWLWETAGHSATTTASEAARLPAERRRFEIRYDRWQLFGKRHYPLRIAFYENGALVRRLAAEKVVVDAALDAGLMDLEALRQAARPPETDASQQEASEDPAVDEIQEAIDIFKQRYE
ncbi:MAG: hypothetical protein QNJ22_21805 [Desulfosarcinaceae bacterium]|nr:hypothetical protein [Desulfosarcinaceae bacterium]